MRRPHLSPTTVLAIGAAALVGALSLTLFLTDSLRGPELGSVDRRFDLRGAQPEPEDIAVVVVDAKTFDSVAEGGLGLQWPFPREKHAEVIDRLVDDGARAIAVDIQFTEETDVRNDTALIAAVDRAPRIALATTEVAADGSTRILGGDELLQSIGARPGNAVFPNDPGGVIRRMRHTTQRLKTLPVVAAEVATGERIAASELGRSSAWIDYRGPPGTIRSISYADVLNGRFAAGPSAGAPSSSARARRRCRTCTRRPPAPMTSCPAPRSRPTRRGRPCTASPCSRCRGGWPP